MRLLGIDYGRKRIGLAFSQDDTVMPLKTITVTSRDKALDEIAKLSREHDVDKVVLGLPRRLSGNISKMTQEVRNFGDQLTGKLEADVVYSEEQLTTQEASRILQEAPGRKKKKLRDQVAAVLIVKQYLGSI